MKKYKTKIISIGNLKIPLLENNKNIDKKYINIISVLMWHV
jgi:hypothetical protein